MINLFKQSHITTVMEKEKKRKISKYLIISGIIVLFVNLFYQGVVMNEGGHNDSKAMISLVIFILFGAVGFFKLMRIKNESKRA